MFFYFRRAMLLVVQSELVHLAGTLPISYYKGEMQMQLGFPKEKYPDFSYFFEKEEDIAISISMQDSTAPPSAVGYPPGYVSAQSLGYTQHHRIPSEMAAFKDRVAIGEIQRRGVLPHELVFDPKEENSFFCFGEDILGKLVGRDSKDDGHILVLGGSGSGKTTGIALPTLATWKGPIFTFDFKGDLTAWSKDSGRDPEVLFLLEGWGNEFYLDPYDLLRKGGEGHVIENAREIAEALIPLYSENRKDTFWIYAARGLLSAAIAYYFRLGLDFIDTMLLIKKQNTCGLVETIRRDPLASMCLPGELLHSSEQTAGVSTDIHNYILDFVSNQAVLDALSASPAEHKQLITWEDLAHRDIFIRIDQSRVSQWSSLIRLMLVQLIKTLERRPEKFSPEGQQIEPTLLLLDEFPQYGQVKELTSAMKVLRSKNVTFSLFCQSFADLEETYGKATRETIVDNCSYLAVLGAQDPDTSKYLSEMIGTYKDVNSSISCNKDIYGQTQSFNTSLTEVERPVIRPEEFKTLDDIILLNPYEHGFCRVKKSTWFQKAPPEMENLKKGDNHMGISIENRLHQAEQAEKKAKFLEDQRKLAQKKEAEDKKKNEARKYFIIGEMVTRHFPRLLERCLEGPEAEKAALENLDSILYLLSIDRTMMETLQSKAHETALFLAEGGPDEKAEEACEE